MPSFAFAVEDETGITVQWSSSSPGEYEGKHQSHPRYFQSPSKPGPGVDVGSAVSAVGAVRTVGTVGTVGTMGAVGASA